MLKETKPPKLSYVTSVVILAAQNELICNGTTLNTAAHC